MLMVVSASGHTRKKNSPLDADIHVQESPPHKRFFVGCSSTFHATRRTSRRFVLGAGNVCLVGENPTCPVSAL